MPEAAIPWLIGATAVATLGAGVITASATNKAAKTAKSTAENQMNMQRAAQEELKAKDAAAKADVEKAQVTATSQAQASLTKKKRAVARSESIYTSPLGIGGTADVARKTLLGA